MQKVKPVSLVTFLGQDGLSVSGYLGLWDNLGGDLRPRLANNFFKNLCNVQTLLFPLVLWRTDQLCGPSNPLPSDGFTPAQCDPSSNKQCCSNHGWCGGSSGHCDCQECIDYAKWVSISNPCTLQMEIIFCTLAQVASSSQTLGTSAPAGTITCSQRETGTVQVGQLFTPKTPLSPLCCITEIGPMLSPPAPRVSGWHS